jgi:predicted RNase H-like HicB family nuclease
MKITVTISRAGDGSFWCQTEEPIIDSYLSSTGSSVAEAKEDLQVCLEDALEDLREQGKEVGSVEFTYKYDMQSFFDYFSFLNISEVGRRAGINPSLMRQYATGAKIAGEKTYGKLSACMSHITEELKAATF